MKTRKQQFNSAASGAIVHLRGRERALEGFGWAGRQAEWIALACLHGGVFTRAQWTSFLGCHHEKVRRAVRALVAQGVAVEEDPPGIDGIGRVCRIHARRIYRALGAGNRRRRRITSTEVLMRRLLSLDYVLDHSRLPWLPTEPEKVAAFEALGIERPLLPQRVYRGAAGNASAGIIGIAIGFGANAHADSLGTRSRRPSVGLLPLPNFASAQQSLKRLGVG